MFSAISRRYDLANTVLSLSRDSEWRRRAVRELGRRRRVIDVATGTGELALLASEAAELVVGTDFSASMLEIAGEKASERSKRVKLVLCDAHRLCFRRGSFDGALLAFGLRNFEDMQGALEELSRVLAPGGKAVILEFTLPPSRVLRRIYSIYFFHLLPLIGGMLTGRRDAYAYLPASVSEFPPPEHVVECMKRAGFENVRVELLTAGIVAMYSGVRKRE